METGRGERYLALDYGDKNIGAAVSAPGNRTAFGAGTIRRERPEIIRAVIHSVKELVKRYGITQIVLGDPRNMDGTPSARSETTLRFKAKLERMLKHVSVILWDERLSTAAVRRARPDGRPDENVDEMAAVYILQGFLDYKMKEL